jgi:hypothetical protein
MFAMEAYLRAISAGLLFTEKGGWSMLGIPDFSIWLVYMLCIFSTLTCVIYGLINWNEGAEDETAEIEEEIKWKKEEVKPSL